MHVLFMSAQYAMLHRIMSGTVRSALQTVLYVVCSDVISQQDGYQHLFKLYLFNML